MEASFKRLGLPAAAGLPITAGLLLALSAPGLAQGLLPPVGADVRVGDLRREFERSFQTQPSAVTPGYTIIPSIEVQGAWTDAVRSNGRAVADFYTGIIPGIAVTADTRRLKGSFFLAPEFRFYATQGNQNHVYNNLNTSGELTVLEDLLFIDMRGYANTQSRQGGLGPNGTVSLSRQDQVETQSYTIGPVLRRRFGDIGRAELGYSYTHTSIDGGSGQVASPFAGSIGNQTLDTNKALASFTTGEAFGRYNAVLEMKYSNSKGSGTIRRSHRYSQIADLGYAYTRTIKFIGALGHEDIYYRGLTTYRNEGAVYTGGIQFTPDPDTDLSLLYGHRDGSTGISFDGNYAATARTRLNLRYSTGVGSEQEDLQNTLASSTTNSSGVPIDSRTGAPLTANNNFFGTLGNVYRTERLSASATVLMDRNVVTLTLRRDDRTLLSQGAVPTNGATPALRQTGTYGSIAFQRDLSDALSSTLFLQYGVRNTASTGDQDSITASATLSYQLSQTLSARAQYSYNSGGSTAFTQQTNAQNLLLLSLRKSF